MSTNEAVAQLNTIVETNADDNPFGPIMKDGVYNDKAHHYSEERRVNRDLTIPKIAEELGEEVLNFVKVESLLGGTKHKLVYHPNPDGDLGEGLEWIAMPALYKKAGGRFYKEIANGRLEWHYMTLKGDILSFITNTFGESLINNQHVDDLKGFAKKVAKFIMDYPHQENGTYGCYLIMFLNLIKVADDKLSNASLQKIAIAIAAEMKRVLEYDPNNNKLTDKEVYCRVRDISVKLTVQQCSKNVHYKISLIDQGAKKASLQLEELDKLAEEEIDNERKEKAAKMQAILNAKFNIPTLGKAPPQKVIEDRKRKIEEVDKDQNEDDNRPSKMTRIDDPQDLTVPNVPTDEDLLFGVDN